MVLKVEKSGRSAIRETNLVASAIWDDFVFDQDLASHFQKRAASRGEVSIFRPGSDSNLEGKLMAEAAKSYTTNEILELVRVQCARTESINNLLRLRNALRAEIDGRIDQTRLGPFRSLPAEHRP